ncbi:hypothetical protein T4D_12656 [Trichinella pseudospiralis]|uniref:Uncharacterized protein n=1 Tax=Trichinella pseudospiralis TaxID=6337 RepID=A0A0V1FI37_TRIPS|nr:hypothetical protein T4D_12656 [Trichinella pseudospiralis]
MYVQIDQYCIDAMLALSHTYACLCTAATTTTTFSHSTIATTGPLSFLVSCDHAITFISHHCFFVDRNLKIYVQHLKFYAQVFFTHNVRPEKKLRALFRFDHIFAGNYFRDFIYNESIFITR